MTWLELAILASVAGTLVWAITKDKRWATLATLIPVAGKIFLSSKETKNDTEEPYDDPPEDDVEDVPDTDDDLPIDDYVQDVHRRGTEGD